MLPIAAYLKFQSQDADPIDPGISICIYLYFLRRFFQIQLEVYSLLVRKSVSIVA